MAVEIERMLLTFVMAVLGYALMLIVMTYVVVFPLQRVSDLTVRDISSQFVLGWLWGSLCSGDFIPTHLAP